MSRRMYVVSSEDKGVIFVTLNPLRVATITRDNIIKYAAAVRKTPEEIFRQIAGAARGWIDKAKQPSASSRDSDVDILPENGLPASDTDYAIAVDLRNDAWQEDRNPHPPIRDGLVYLNDIKAGSRTTIHGVKLYNPAMPQPPKPKPRKGRKKKKTGPGKKS